MIHKNEEVVMRGREESKNRHGGKQLRTEKKVVT